MAGMNKLLLDSDAEFIYIYQQMSHRENGYLYNEERLTECPGLQFTHVRDMKKKFMTS